MHPSFVAFRTSLPTFSRALSPRVLTPVFSHQRSQLRAGTLRVAAMSIVSSKGKPLYDLYVKGSPEKGELGDCPFSHRTMLTLEEKGIPYNKLLLDELNMPEWIAEVTDGKKQIPFATELESGKWLHDSDMMVPYLEDKFPQRKLGKPDELPQVGSNLFPAFMEYVKTTDKADEDAKREALIEELKKIDADLKKSEGPYVGGQDVNAVDLKLGPQLKHVIIGSKAQWELPKELTAVHAFMEAIQKRESWKNTYYTEKYVADGWHKKLETMGVKK
ncbi:Glutathione S-transferase DHAR2 [Coccomyxa sp. Obi]|nr:Glutathione S-transferase DHAR2 [Coccomyxa sp. Obi]